MPDADSRPRTGAQAWPRPVARSQIVLGDRSELRDGWDVSLPPARTSTAARTTAAAGPKGLTLADASRLQKVAVRAGQHGPLAARLPAYGRSDRDGHGTLRVGSGPGEWLLLSATRSAADLGADLGVDLGADLDADLGADFDAQGVAELVSLVEVTHGRAMVRLTGEAAAATLAKLTPVDLTDRCTPHAAALRCAVAGLVTDVVRDDRSGRPSYLLHCERSSGQYLFDVLADAGQEFGLRPVTASAQELLG
jgi:heterotetrameric sarcosine oxidase gamma subunit